MRLFLAIELPEPVRREIARRMAKLERELPRARWVRPEGVHLTLCFLGETEASLLPVLSAGFRPAFARCPPLSLRVTAAGTFPPGRPARVAWLGLEGPPDLGRLQSELARSAEELAGVAPEERAFHPHLTLARPDPPWPLPVAERFAVAFGGGLGEAFEVGRGVLLESQLGPGGSRYRVAEAFPLAGGLEREPG
jgi:2'-5' RNA ligase